MWQLSSKAKRLALNLALIAFILSSGPGIANARVQGAAVVATVQGRASTPALPTSPTSAGQAQCSGIDADGGTRPIGLNATISLPAGAVSTCVMLHSYTVESRLDIGLSRYHSLQAAIHIDARQAGFNLPAPGLLRPATVSFNLGGPEIPPTGLKHPGVRVLEDGVWQLIPSRYDAAAKTLTADLASLPAIVAAVDGSEPPSAGDWDPSNPSSLQLSDGSWGVAYQDNAPNVLYRRGLLDSGILNWTDPVTVSAAADSVVLARFGNSLAAFYRKSDGTYKQVVMSTSADDGITWGTAVTLTSEITDVYQIQAVVDSGTMYLFWSLSNTSGLLQYITSTDLATWSVKATIGQAIGPLTEYTYPSFDIKRFTSGTWGLTWLNVSAYNEISGTADNNYYPVVMYAMSTNLSAWPAGQEITLPYSQRWPKGLSLSQDGSGLVYLSWTHYVYPWDNYVYYMTSADDGATWSGQSGYSLWTNINGAYCTDTPTQSPCDPANWSFVQAYYETMFGYEPSRNPNGWAAVTAANSYLALDNNNGLRAFWDMSAGNGSDPYPVRLFYRDLPSGNITPMPVVKDPLSECGCGTGVAHNTADPVNTATGNFMLPETDISIPGRGPGLTFQRTYNSFRLEDGPLGYGWTDNFNTNLKTFTHGEVLIIDATGRSDLYAPAARGGYISPPGRNTILTHNADGTWTVAERNQVKQTFDASGNLVSMADRNGNALTLAYSGGLLSSVTDQSGRSLTFAYDGSHISSITDPLSRTVTFGYSGAGDLTSATDPNGASWSYAYATSHQLQTEVDPNNHTVLNNTYGALGRVTSQEDARGDLTRFSYGQDGGSTTVTDPRGYTTIYYYDTAYRVTGVTNANSRRINRTWDANNDLVTVQDARGLGSEWTYYTYDSYGNMLTRKDNLNHVWTHTYDSLNDVLTKKDPLGHVITYTYDITGNLATATDANGEQTRFGHDPYGEVISTTDPLGNTTLSGYDAYGDNTVITNALGLATTKQFDLVGRVITQTDPLGHSVTFGYDKDNRLLSTTDALGNTTSYGYDAVGNRTVITDANGSATYYGYDENNKLGVVTDTLGNATTYGYDADDNLITVTNALTGTTTYGYDNLNRLIRVSDPLTDTTSYGYDDFDNRIRMTSANGYTTTYSYDGINRLTQTTYPDNSTVKYAYDADSQRTSMIDSLGTSRDAYDPVGRLISTTSSISGTVQYSYDADGERTGLTYPDGKQVQYGYDPAGKLITVTDWANNVVTYTYDNVGRLAGATLPNGTSASYSYDAANRLIDLAHTSDVSGTINSFAYSLDDVGNRTAMTDTSGVTAYAYDKLYRLKQVNYPDGTTVSYDYDAVGNRKTMTNTNGVTSYSYDAADRLQSAGPITFTWDAHGNMKTRVTPGGTISYTYDYANRLTQVLTGTDTFQYYYDGDGTRLRKSVDGSVTDYLWDVASGLPVVISDTNDVYLYGLDLVSRQDLPSGTLQYYHADGLGSVRNLTDASGAIIGSASYDAFGALRTGTANGDFQFAGQESDPETGLYYLRARYYDPAVGRFTQQDTWPGDTASPYSLNPYLYVEDNPANMVDPSGMFPGLGDIEGWIETGLNATATPAYAPSEEGQSGNLGDLEAASNACGTGGALPAIGTGADILSIVGLLVPGEGEVGAAANGSEDLIAIRGFTQHGIDQVISRGVRPYEIMDALRNPVRVVAGRDGVIRYIGKWAELRINSMGDIVTAIRFKAPGAP